MIKSVSLFESGMSYTGGTLSRQGIKAAENGAAVQLLLNAGAIPLLVSNTSELCTALHTFNYLFGATVNPYDTRKTSGGSSGGEVIVRAIQPGHQTHCLYGISIFNLESMNP